MNTYLLALFLSMVTAPELVVFVLYEAITSSGFNAFIITMIISLGGTAGSGAIYLAARLVGQKRCLHLIRRHGRKILLKPDDLDKIDYYYEKWGGVIVFFGRWLPTFRSLVSIPAGLSKMSFWKFIAFTFSGTMVWNLILCSIVYGFGAYLDYLEMGLEGYTWAAFSALLLLTVYFIVRRTGERIMKGPEAWSSNSENRGKHKLQ